MALNWDLTAIKDYDDLLVLVPEMPDRKKPGPVTETLIWATIAVGLGEITEANWRTFYARLNMYERFSGPFLRDGADGSPVYVKPSDVWRHVGLRCNVSYETDAKWLRRIFGEDLKRTVRRLPADLSDEAALKTADELATSGRW